MVLEMTINQKQGIRNPFSLSHVGRDNLHVIASQAIWGPIIILNLILESKALL